jgi:ornithine carbamoyltransferase
MSKRNLLRLSSLSLEEVAHLIDRARHYKQKPDSSSEVPVLKGMSIGLLFEKPSTRTRVSFEAAIVKLGGYPVFLSANEVQIKRGETIADSARVLGHYLDGLVIRTHRHAHLEEWAAFSIIPVINGLSDLYHPCQVLADLFTIFEKKKHLKGLRLAYIGDGNNMAYSLMEGGALSGMNVTVASPAGFTPNPEIVDEIKKLANGSGAQIVITEDPKEAAREADILYTDVWISMGDEGQESVRRTRFQGYQINDALIERAHPECLVMHCLPAHRGEEITHEAMEGARSVIFEQAANRLPMHQAILERLIEHRGTHPHLATEE